MDDKDDHPTCSEASDCDLLGELLGEDAPPNCFTCALCSKELTRPRSLAGCKHLVCRECLQGSLAKGATRPDDDIQNTATDTRARTKIRDRSSHNPNRDIDSLDEESSDSDFDPLPPVQNAPDLDDIFGLVGAIDPILQRDAMLNPLGDQDADANIDSDSHPIGFFSQQTMSSQGSAANAILSQNQDDGSGLLFISDSLDGRASGECATVVKATKSVICPICFVATYVVAEDLCDMSPDSLAMLQRDFPMDEDAAFGLVPSSEINPKADARCGSDDCTNPAAYFCETECGYLCLECEKQHRRFTYTRLHHIKEIGALRESSATMHSKMNLELCNLHPYYRIEFFCLTCSSQNLACLKCVVETHHLHNVVPLDVGLSIIKEKLLNQISQTFSIREKLEDIQLTSKEKVKRLLETEEQVLAAIHQACQNYDTKLEKVAQDLISSALSYQLEISKNIQLDVENVNSAAADAEEKVAISKETLEAVEHTSDIQILASANDSLATVITRVKSMTETECRQIRFRPNNSITLYRESGNLTQRPSLGNVYLWNQNKKNDQYSFRPLDQMGRARKAVGRSGARPLEFDHAWGICVNPQTGNLYVADQFNHRIQVLSPDLEYLFHFGKYGTEPGFFNNPISVCVSPDGEFVVVTDNGNHRLQIFLPDGEFLRVEKLDQATGEQFRNPINVAISKEPDACMYVTDTRNERVYIMSRNGEFRKSFGRKTGSEETIGMAEAITITEKNEVCVLARGGSRIVVYDLEGGFLRALSIEPVRGRVSMTWGPEATLWVADSDNHQVVVYSESGEKLKVIGSSGHGDSQLTSPMGVAFGPNGYFYVCDYGNSRIQIF